MDQSFKNYVNGLEKQYQKLMNMEPLRIDQVSKNNPTGGVYLFSEGKKHLYAGRTKRSIRTRLKEHVGSSDDCPLARRITREITKKKPSDGSRDALLKNLKEIYKDSKERIKKMDVRYVEETDPIKQALLEIYVAIATKTEHNSFETH